MQKGSKWEETGHFRHLGKRRSLHGRHGDKGLFRASEGRHLVAMATESLKNASGRSPFGGHHGDPPLQVATSFLKTGSPHMVAIVTLICKWLPLHTLQGRHLWSPWHPRGASGDLYTICSWSPLAKWRKRWCSWRPLHLTVLRTMVTIATK